MLNIFRKSKKVYAVLMTLMLLVPMQQSFSQTLNSASSFRMTTRNVVMEHCDKSKSSSINITLSKNFTTDIINDSDLATKAQYENCCTDNVCDSISHCSFSVSFLALFSNHELYHSFDSQRLSIFVDRHEIPVLTSKLFRPPKIV